MRIDYIIDTLPDLPNPLHVIQPYGIVLDSFLNASYRSYAPIR